jgi:hypothetical protein
MEQSGTVIEAHQEDACALLSLEEERSRLYAIHITADEIFIVNVILALRDSHRRRGDRYSWRHPGST